MSSVLALDLGTQMGWALKRDNHIMSGSEGFHTNRFCGGGRRFLKFVNFLEELNKTYPVETVYFEEVRRHIGTDAAHVYGGFLAHLTAWCEQREVPYEGVSIGTIKKHATGKGNANKQEMIDAAKEKGFTPVDDNEADALALLLCVSESKNLVNGH